MRQLLYTSLILLIFSCNTSKYAFNNGKYDEATKIAIDQIIKGRKVEKNATYLQRAFNAANQKDEIQIKNLLEQNSPNNFETIYTIYCRIAQRQNDVDRVLPLYNAKYGKTLSLYFVDISKKEFYYNAFLENYYTQANAILSSTDKDDIQKAYNLLQKINSYNANYKDVQQLLLLSKQLGTKYYLININCEDGFLKSTLLNQWNEICLTKLNNNWRKFDFTKQQNNYDGVININYDDILFSPERERINNYLDTVMIPTTISTEYLLSENKKDTLSVFQKQNYKVEQAYVSIYERTKNLQINGAVSVLLEKNPPTVFKHTTVKNWNHIFGVYEGCYKALSPQSLYFVNNAQLNFPSNIGLFGEGNKEWTNYMTNNLQKVL